MANSAGYGCFNEPSDGCGRYYHAQAVTMTSKLQLGALCSSVRFAMRKERQMLPLNAWQHFCSLHWPSLPYRHHMHVTQSPLPSSLVLHALLALTQCTIICSHFPNPTNSAPTQKSPEKRDQILPPGLRPWRLWSSDLCQRPDRLTTWRIRRQGKTAYPPNRSSTRRSSYRTRYHSRALD